MFHFGIDVGCEGAMACLDHEGQLVAVQDLEITRLGKMAWCEPLSIVSFISTHRRGAPAQAYLEYVAPQPKLSTISAAGMGRTHGSVLAALQCAAIPFEMVSPQAWKKALNVTAPENSTDSQRKKITLDKARIRFPGTEYFDRAMDHNRAEAALIAHYGRMRWAGPSAASMKPGAAAPF